MRKRLRKKFPAVGWPCWGDGGKRRGTVETPSAPTLPLGGALWLPGREGYLFLSSGAGRDFLIRLLPLFQAARPSRDTDERAYSCGLDRSRPAGSGGLIRSSSRLALLRAARFAFRPGTFGFPSFVLNSIRSVAEAFGSTRGKLPHLQLPASAFLTCSVCSRSGMSSTSVWLFSARESSWSKSSAVRTTR